MGLEVATYIEQLVESNPLGTDSKAQGDNHVRLLKSVLKNQFPNLGTEAVTPTAAEINDLIDNNRGVPTGAIVMWAGSVASLPAGWNLCDGTNGTPNLADRFIIGSTTDVGGTYDIGDTGGSADSPSSTEAHVLTEAQIPAHHHFVANTDIISGTSVNLSSSNYVVQYNTYGSNDPTYLLRGSSTLPTVGRTSSVGSGQGHSHAIAGATGGNIPPYYALAFIQKA